MFVVYDLETTGFDQSCCDIIEFAYAAFDDNGVFLRAERLYFYHKGMHWGEDAYAVHQIPLSFLAQYEDQFRENVIKMYSVLNKNTVVGHNVRQFDCPFVVSWLNRQGVYGLSFHRVCDTQEIYKPITKRARIKLTKLVERMQISPEMISMFTKQWFGDTEVGLRSHEAGYDVTATALLTLQAAAKNMVIFKPILDEDKKVSINMSDVVSVDNFIEEEAHCVHLELTDANMMSKEYVFELPDLAQDVTISTPFEHVGTRDSTIYAVRVNPTTPITFDTSSDTMRICAPNGITTVTNEATLRLAIATIEEVMT